MLRADAKTLPLTSRAADALLYLVEHRGEVVDKAHLMKAVWPNVVVEDNNLNQCISQLRRILGDTPGQPRFIATVPGRGYRFVAEVSVSNVSAETRASSAPSSRGSTAAKAIAVLPFVNLTGNPDKEYLTDGISEELIHTLTRVHGLKVVSRTSSFAYKNRNVDVRGIARELGVVALLEGNVSAAGDQIRAYAQLVDGQTGFHIWSQRVDCAMEDVLQVRDELTVAIVEALRLRDGVPSPKTVIVKPPTRDLVAYDLYLQAKFIYSRPHAQTAQRALELLAQALERDPQFASANVLSAMIRFHFLYTDASAPQHLIACEREIARALESDPHSAAGYAAHGTLLALRGDRVSAEQAFRKALQLDELDPAIRLLHAMEVYGPAGHMAPWGEELLVCCRLAPLFATGALNLGIYYLYRGDNANAARCVDLAIELGMPRSLTPVVDVSAKLAMRAHEYTQAAQLYVIDLSDTLRASGAAEVITLVLEAIGDPTRRPKAIEALGELVRTTPPQALGHQIRKRCVLWFVLLGALDDAFAFANATLDHIRDTGTVPTGWAIVWLPEMVAFRADPRFIAIAQRLGLVEYWKTYGAPDLAVSSLAS